MCVWRMCCAEVPSPATCRSPPQAWFVRTCTRLAEPPAAASRKRGRCSAMSVCGWEGRWSKWTGRLNLGATMLEAFSRAAAWHGIAVTRMASSHQPAGHHHQQQQQQHPSPSPHTHLRFRLRPHGHQVEVGVCKGREQNTCQLRLRGAGRGGVARRVGSSTRAGCYKDAIRRAIKTETCQPGLEAMQPGIQSIQCAAGAAADLV